MASEHTASVVLGYIGLLLWSFQLAPQAFSNYRKKDTGVLSVWMMICWSLWAPFYASTAIFNHLVVPNIIQPNVFAVFTTICAVQVVLYNKRKLHSRFQAVATMCSFGILAGMEVGFYTAAKHGDSWVPVLFSSCAIALIVGGFIPQYWDVLRTKDSQGISLAFLALDISGGIFSILSLALQHPFDAVSCGSYIAVVLLDVGLVICHFIFSKPPNIDAQA